MADNRKWPISRRTFLKGSGSIIGLPFLEAMMPSNANAATPGPKRFIVSYIPNGIVEEQWLPTERASGPLTGEISQIFAPLSNFKKNMLLLSNISHVAAVRDRWDGSGSAHAFASSSFLTGALLDSDSREFYAAKSIDQYIADDMYLKTRIPSIELGCDPTNLSQACSLFSPVYPQTISWRSATAPNPKEINPRKAFERLFQINQAQALSRRSILDVSKNSLNDLLRRSGLGAADKIKLDEYLTSVREVEISLERIQTPNSSVMAQKPMFDRDPGEDYREILRLQFKIMGLALKTDTTRVASLLMGQEVSTRVYGFLGIDETHHDLSHYRNNRGEAASRMDLAKINRFHVEEFAKFVQELAQERDADGSLLDSSLVLYGGGMSDGNTHSLKKLPILLLGGKQTPFAWGNHMATPDGSTVGELHLTLGRAMGLAAMQSFAGATSLLPIGS